MAINKKSNLLECIFISKKSLEISLNLTSQIKQLSLTHFVLIVTEPNLEARSFYSEYRGILVQINGNEWKWNESFIFTSHLSGRNGWWHFIGIPRLGAHRKWVWKVVPKSRCRPKLHLKCTLPRQTREWHLGVTPIKLNGGSLHTSTAFLAQLYPPNEWDRN